MKERVIKYKDGSGWRLKFVRDVGGLTIFQKNQHRRFVKYVCLSKDDIDVLRGFL